MSGRHPRARIREIDGLGPNYQVKASVFRAYVKWLEQQHLLAWVIPRLGASTAALVAEPPLASTWMASGPLDELVAQIEAHGGLDEVKRAAREILRDQLGPLLVPMARNILRVIGPSPATVFRYWPDIVKTVMRDVDWTWTETGEAAGYLTMTYQRGSNVSVRAYYSTLPSLETALELTGKKGTVADPELVTDRSARFPVRWSG